MKTNGTKFKLSRENHQLIGYWRESLIDSLQAEVRSGRNSSVEAPDENFKRGSCSPTVYVRLLELREKGADRRRQTIREDQDEPLPVLLCPLILQRTGSSFGPRTIEAFWVPALLNASGELNPPHRGEPWVPRTLLDPQISDDCPVIGSDEAQSDFSALHRHTLPREWKDYWRFTEDLFFAVAGARLQSFELEGFSRRKNGLVALDSSSNGWLLPLAELYRRVLEGRQSPGLIPALAKRDPEQSRPFKETRGWISKTAFKHCGQFGNAFPLSSSQRRAVQHGLGLEAEKFLCVTGPPGTGKTTMLQSIVASLWVFAARDRRSVPPLIVGTGATNQAVTNIITAMEKSGNDGSLLASRWLPKVESYGSFCASATKAKDASAVEGYQLELLRGESFSRSLENYDYLSAARQSYLENFRACFGKKMNLAGAVKFLAREIVRKRSELYQGIAELRDGSLQDWLKALLFLKPRKPTSLFFEELGRFDQELRYRLFLLAGRFWEGRFLLELDELSHAGFNRENADRLALGEQDWRRRAMLTPAFVCTIAMLPRFFSDREFRGAPPVDLLIFDEASQVSPEIGAACLALARRALIVGDDQQLEPVWNVPSNVDRANAAACGLSGRDEKRGWAELNRKGLLASNGSLMRWSLRCSKYNDGASTIGVFLSEQRRSVPEIVAVCNDLAYRGRLRALRSASVAQILPALGWFHCQGRSERVGTSRRNDAEAEAIAAWIEKHRADLLSFYEEESLEQVLAVITPFAAQADLLNRKLARAFPDEKILVGSVNSLQGAERPVVIFSTVYDTTFTEEYFFDRSTNMLNVAVSRAKDSFLVFGSMEIYHGRTGRPSWVLSRHLFADEGNDITEELSPAAGAETEEHSWIASLEGHRDALRNAISEAKRELFIVSPTISSAAVKADRIPELIKDARERGVAVLIYTDCDLDLEDSGLKPRAAEGRRLLLDAGAEIFVVNGIHAKVVGVDNSTYIDGSFNWLSANRSLGSRHQKLETSNCYRGKEAARRIKLLKDEMRHRGFVDQLALIK